MAAGTTTSGYADGLGVGAMNRYQVTSEVMLATERATARLVLASVWLGAVGVVGLNVGLQIEGTSERYRNNSQRGELLVLGKGQLPLGQFGHWYFLFGSSCMVSSLARWAVSEGCDTTDG